MKWTEARYKSFMNWTEAKPLIHGFLFSTDQLALCKFSPLKIWLIANIFRGWYIDQHDKFTIITDSLLRQWTTEDGITIFDLEETAVKNDQNAFFICKVSEVMEDTNGIDVPIYCINRGNGPFGAVGILDTAIQNQLYNIFPDGYYILPSSIHEVLAVPSDMVEIDHLIKIVRKVNQAETDDTDRLSNHVFMIRQRRLTIVS